MDKVADDRRQHLSELETRIDYRFSDDALLDRALTHSSAKKAGAVDGDYERLEFLGDRVLGLCIAEILYQKFPDASEGDLNVRFSALVNGKLLAEISDHLKLHEFISVGSDLQQLTGKRMQSVRADVVEALIASLYLDGGMEPAKAFIKRFWNAHLDEVATIRRDPKTELQEWAHGKGLGTPRYSEIGRTGPDHDPEFTVSVWVEGQSDATGTGRSKRRAEQLAAEKVLYRLGVWTKEN